MTPVLSRAQMRAFEAHAIAAGHVPGALLMENAGRGATDVLLRETPGSVPGARIAVVCGTGNNGGDGFVMARHLLVRGRLPVVVLVGDPARLSADARLNLAAWRGTGGEVIELVAGGSLSPLEKELARASVVVDALFGTGLDRPIDGTIAEVVTAMNRASAPRFSVDVPSGLDADTGVTLGVAVSANVTVTFAFPKLGLLTPSGARLAGRLHVTDIGIPAGTLAPDLDCPRLIEEADLASWTGPRSPAAHKTSAGHVAILGGSAGKVGAPQLAARGALRGGAGVATIVTWPEAASAIEGNLLEVMCARLDRGALPGDLDAHLTGKHSVVVGPGFGLDTAARAAVEHVLASWPGPLIVDADALTLFANQPGAFAVARHAILTPHPGEVARLLGKTSAQIESDRFGAARALVTSTRAVVVLKGAHTIIAAPDGRIAISPVACAALATAGSGDVLSGIIGATACSLPTFEAACCGVMLHARAGERWSRAHGDADRGMLASEIADALRA
jgi:hydroxyethylthiazole kinase-like uncharacterized protein yjeF